jgi:hypothetical protein
MTQLTMHETVSVRPTVQKEDIRGLGVSVRHSVDDAEIDLNLRVARGNPGRYCKARSLSMRSIPLARRVSTIG